MRTHLVLHKGGSGFIGSWVIQKLISSDYHVRAAVRNSSKGEYLREKFGDKFEFVIIEDIQAVTISG